MNAASRPASHRREIIGELMKTNWDNAAAT